MKIALDSIKKIKSGEKEILRFSLVLSSLMIIFAIYFIFQEKYNYSLWLFLISIIVLFLSLFLPFILKPIQKIWMAIGIIIGIIISSMILIILFFIILTPISLFLRLSGKNFLNSKIDKKTNSYWTVAETIDIKKEDYKKQF